MGGPGSGKRRLLPTTVELPDVGSTEDSILTYINAVTRGIVQGQLDHSIGRELLAGARVALSAIREKHGKEKIERLQKMLDEAKAVASKGLANEVADRQHRSGR